jgi:hypothetical protein
MVMFSGVVEQAGQYSIELPTNIPHVTLPLPFLYESTGRERWQVGWKRPSQRRMVSARITVTKSKAEAVHIYGKSPSCGSQPGQKARLQLQHGTIQPALRQKIQHHDCHRRWQVHGHRAQRFLITHQQQTAKLRLQGLKTNGAFSRIGKRPVDLNQNSHS